jgi:hypothetical protein
MEVYIEGALQVQYRRPENSTSGTSRSTTGTSRRPQIIIKKWPNEQNFFDNIPDVTRQKNRQDTYC